VQCVHGCVPSHLIFLRRHSSHARVTLRRFCRCPLILIPFCSVAPIGPPKGECGDVSSSCFTSSSSSMEMPPSLT